jgi:alcohol dehydrogenase class IV
VIDAGVKAAGILQQALDALPGMAVAVAVFDQTPPNPTEADGIALDGLARGWAHIDRITAKGQDREARMKMMSASAQGALAFQKGLGSVHSLSRMQPMAYGMGIGAIEEAAM